MDRCIKLTTFNTDSIIVDFNFSNKLRKTQTDSPIENAVSLELIILHKGMDRVTKRS